MPSIVALSFPDAPHRHSWQKGSIAIPPTRGEDAANLQISWIHQLNKVFHNDIHAILMKIAMVTETEKIKFQTLAFHHILTRNIINNYLSKIRLTRFRAKAGKLRASKSHEILILGMLVLKVSNTSGAYLSGYFVALQPNRVTPVNSLSVRDITITLNIYYVYGTPLPALQAKYLPEPLLYAPFAKGTYIDDSDRYRLLLNTATSLQATICGTSVLPCLHSPFPSTAR